MSRKLNLAVAIVGLSISSLVASASAGAADESGAYLGVGIGQASYTVDEIGFDASASAFKFFTGYAFNKYFATELTYIDAGTSEETIAAGTVRIQATGLIVSAIGQLPLGERFSLFGKLGIASYDTKSSLQATSTNLSEKNRDDDLAYGIGAAFSVGQHFSVRIEYEEIDLSDGDFSILSASGVFNF